MPTLTPAQLVEVTRLTGLSSDELNDLFAMPKADQALVIRGYKDMSWVKNKDTLKEVIAALGVVVSIAGGIGTVAGGVLGVVSLLKLLL